MKNNRVIGYTAGVFDMFHIGHLRLLENAKGMCDYLVVGVTTDDLAQYKGKKPIISYNDRAEIVRNIKSVDAVVPQINMDKVLMCKKIKASYLFVGDDWYETDKWKTYEEELSKIGVKVIYFPYTDGISSTMLRKELENEKN